MEHTNTAAQLQSLLSLERPPVALTFVDQAPDGLPVPDAPAPSACAFWRRAERGTFYAAADQHYNCPVGSMVMGFELPDSVQQQLGGLVQSMCDSRYLTMDEAAMIPSVGRRSAGIVYGPLAEFPLRPDVVLLWLNSAQAMLFNEAAGTAQWTAAPMDVSGRPGCAALPLALERNQPRMSLGCMGMRVFTEIPDEQTLAVVPGEQLTEFLQGLDRIVEANAAMRDFYTQHKASIA